MHDLAAALESEARLHGQIPIIVQLLIEQQLWIRKNLSEGHVPGVLNDCSCTVCENARDGYGLLRRFDDLKLTGQRSTLQP